MADAVRDFCEFRNLVPRGVKLTPEDVWDRVSYVLSVKMQNPQFAGQMKEKLASRESAAFVGGVVQGCVRALAEPASRRGRAHRAVRDRRTRRRA